MLYPDGLAFINKPFEVELAYNEKFEERLKRPDVQAAITTLSTPLPELRQDLANIAAAAVDLNKALTAVRDARLDKLGNPLSPELFEARRDGIEVWATFVRNVEKVHKGDGRTEKQAREALIGEWKRLVAVAGDEATTPVPPVTPA